MKPTVFKSIFILSLLFGTVSCVSHNDIDTPVVKASDVNSIAPQSFTTRTLGNALGKSKSNDSSSEVDEALQKRIEALEKLVTEQQKLIELYKQGN